MTARDLYGPGRTVTLKARYWNFKTVTRSKTVDFPINLSHGGDDSYSRIDIQALGDFGEVSSLQIERQASSTV